jgi:hypothetical protein
MQTSLLSSPILPPDRLVHHRHCISDCWFPVSANASLVCHLPEPASEHLPPPGTVARAPAPSRPDRSRPPHWLLQAVSRLCHQPPFWPCAQFMPEPISWSQMHWGWGDRALSGTVAIAEGQK